MIGGLDIPGMAELLHLNCREYLELAASDPRIVAQSTLESQWAVMRTCRWLDSSRPVANPEHLAFIGSDAVRAIVVRSIATLPAPVAWHAVAFVSWLEVGRSAIAWQSRVPLRVAHGDAPHFIVLSGMIPDEDLPGVIGHELAHSWHCGVAAPRAAVPMSAHERTARDLVVAKDRGLDADALARELVYEERLADRTSTGWGLTRATDELELMRLFQSRVNASAALAVDIGHQVDEQIAAQRAAMIATTTSNPGA